MEQLMILVNGEPEAMSVEQDGGAVDWR